MGPRTSLVFGQIWGIEAECDLTVLFVRLVRNNIYVGASMLSINV